MSGERPRPRIVAVVASAALLGACLAGSGSPDPPDRDASSSPAPVASVSSPLTWAAEKDIVPPGAPTPSTFGDFVVAAPSRVLVGDTLTNKLYLFGPPLPGGDWRFEGIITREGSLSFGAVLAATDDTAFVRSRPVTQQGMVVGAYTKGPSGWGLAQDLQNDAHDRQTFGRSIAVNGSTLAVSATTDSGPEGGVVFMYDRTADGRWIFAQKLTAPAQAVGAAGAFGSSVALRDGVLAVGSSDEGDAPADHPGAVHLYVKGATRWQHLQRLGFSGTSTYSGLRVCFADDVLAVQGWKTVQLFRKGPSGYESAGALDVQSPGSRPVHLLCAAGRIAVVTAAAGVDLFTRSGAHWTVDRLPLGADTLFGFAFRADQLFAGTGAAVRVLRHAKLQGESCSTAASCISGFCVDGVCCDSACGGGAPDDCQACSLSAGARVAGRCEPIAASHVCRPRRGECDVEDRCDGQGPSCPADLVLPNGAGCTGGTCAAGACGGDESSSPTDPDAEAASPGAARADGCSIGGPRPADGAWSFGWLFAIGAIAAHRRRCAWIQRPPRSRRGTARRSVR